MSATMVKAHYDGEHVQFDEPCELAKGTKLVVTVLTPEMEAEREAWFAYAARSFGEAYGPDEPEYSLDDIIKE